MSPFLELYAPLPRQGPGSPDSTRRALAMLPALPEGAAVLDLGCGSGASTAVLAERTDLRITALDTRGGALEQLSAVLPGVTTLQASMGDVPLPDASFDALWSEGAIYNIGFEAGLRSWRRLLRPGGVIAVTEATWKTDTPSPEAAAFWQEYPAMQTIAENCAAVARAGYTLLGHFVLPDTDWLDHYYLPLEARIAQLAPAWHSDEQRAVLAEARREIAIFRRYSSEYGYVFYLMQLPQ